MISASSVLTPQIAKLQNDALLKQKCDEMYARSYQRLFDKYGKQAYKVLKPWVERMQAKLQSLNTEELNKAADAIYRDYHMDRSVLRLCHAAIHYMKNLTEEE